MRRGRFWTGLVVLATVLRTASAPAAERPAQQRCLNLVARHTVGVMTASARTAIACAEVTSRTCLASAARLAARNRWLARADTRWCRAAPDQRPDFGYTDAATLAAAAETAGHGVVTDVLDAAPPGPGTADAHCRLGLAAATARVHRALWGTTLRAMRAALAEPHAVASGDELRDRILAAVATDANGSIARAMRQAEGAARTSCAAVDPIATASGRYHRGLAAATGLAVACDLTDDGLRNLSCVPPALEAHVLNRLGYGPDAFTLARLRALGVPAYVREQLQPQSIPDDALAAQLAQFPSLEMSFLELRVHYPNRTAPGQPQSGDVLKELQRAKILRAVASHRQLEQVLVDFWFNHFNVIATDRRDYDVSPYERIAIRPHMLGRFRDLLLAVVRSPAMGDYLDGRRNRVGALNENFARELLELHTVGAESGFTAADVTAVARAFTGWKENQSTADGFEFVAAWHDPGPKTVLGTTLPSNGGYADGVAVLDLLAAHPSTAARVARKLVVRFVSETPPPALVAAATATYLATGGDLRAVLETIILSPQFLDDAAHRGAKVKRPLHLIASLTRAVGADPAQLNLDRMRRRIRELGEDLYGFPAPSGYPDVSAYWTSPGTMLLRFNIVELAARGGDGIMPAFASSTSSAEATVDALAAELFLAGVSDATRATTVAVVDALGATSPSARTAQAAAVLLSSPEFLVH